MVNLLLNPCRDDFRDFLDSIDSTMVHAVVSSTSASDYTNTRSRQEEKKKESTIRTGPYKMVVEQMMLVWNKRTMTTRLK